MVQTIKSRSPVRTGPASFEMLDSVGMVGICWRAFGVDTVATRLLLIRAYDLYANKNTCCSVGDRVMLSVVLHAFWGRRCN